MIASWSIVDSSCIEAVRTHIIANHLERIGRHGDRREIGIVTSSICTGGEAVRRHGLLEAASKGVISISCATAWEGFASAAPWESIRW